MTHPITHDGHTKDRRYTVAQEYCGQSGKRWVARFCGEWIGQSPSYSGAVLKAVGYKAARNGALVIEEVRA